MRILPRKLCHRGVTLIELLIVVGIMAVMSGMSMVGYNRFQENQSVRVAAAQLSTDLRQTQQKALSGEKPSGWCTSGTLASWRLIFISTTQYDLRSVCSDATTRTDKTVTLPNNTSCSDAGCNTQAIDFLVLTGAADAAETFTVQRVFPGRTVSNSVQVNQAGAVLLTTASAPIPTPTPTPGIIPTITPTPTPGAMATVTPTPTDPSPVGWWKLDENTGTTANDSSGNGVTGTIMGTVLGSNWVAGKTGSAFSFNGTNNYITTDSYQVANNNAFTVAGWIKTSSTANARIYYEGSSLSSSRYMYIDVNENVTGDAEFCIDDDSTAFGCPTVTGLNLNDGQWHHIAGVQSSKSSRTLYVDGVARASNSTTIGTITVNRSTMGANRGTSVSQYLNGTLDDVRVYDSALTPAQIAALYNL